ncbi:MAG: histidine kinase dimerization/phospho-acceptor domain-containing protein [Candidatus Latescibacterota bacterium]
MALSLRTRLLLLFLGLGLLPLVTVALVSYANSVRTVEGVVQERAAQAVVQARADLERVLQARRGEFGLLCRAQEVQALYARRAAAGAQDTVLQQTGIAGLLEQFAGGPREAFVQVHYLDLAGNQVLAWTRATGAGFGQATHSLVRADSTFRAPDLRPYDEDRLQQSTVSSPAYGPVLRLARLVVDPVSGERRGFAVADLQVSQILGDARLSRRPDPGETLVLVDREHDRLLYHPQTGLVGRTLAEALPGLSPVVERMRQQHAGRGRYRQGEETWLVAQQDLTGPAWSLAALGATSQATAPVRRAGLYNLGITLAALVLALLLLPATVRRVTSSVRRVAKGAAAIAAGQLDQEIEVDAWDETAVLATSFNRMARSLKTTMGDLRRLNLELEDRVHRRTLQLEEAGQRLEQQNRDLAVAHALERVRADVASMRHSEELLGLVATVERSLKELGVPCDSAGLGTVDEAAGVMRYWAPALGAISLDTRLLVNEDSGIYASYKEGRTWSRLVSTAEWEAIYRQALHAGYFHSPEEMEQALAARFGGQTNRWVVDAPFSHGTLAMNKPAPEPFTDVDIRLLERFAQVLSLGYARFLDLQAAEERSRQLSLESAVDRVRAEALSMRYSQDLRRVVAVMWHEMVKLGIHTPGCSFQFVDEAAGRVGYYGAMGNPGSDRYSWTSPDLVELDRDTVAFSVDLPVAEFTGPGPGDPFGDFLERWRAAKPWWVAVDEARVQVDAAVLWRRFGATQPWPYRLDAWVGVVTNVPFAHGTVGFREKEYSPEHVAMVVQLAQALSVGYLRFQDFERLEAQNRALAEANARIQEATRQKSAFLARMSHDLRTPMNAIIGYTRILLRRLAGQVDERQYRNLRNIEVSADHLLRLVNDILDLSRVEAGRVDLHPEPVDLARLVAECAAAVSSLVRPGVELVQRLEAVPPWSRIRTACAAS